MKTKRVGFVDTETTGFEKKKMVWSVGIVVCDLTIPWAGDWSVSRRSQAEWILPYLPGDIPSNAFQRGDIMAASRRDCDEAAEHARSMMAGSYDPEGFREEMRDYLEDLRLERVREIRTDLEQCDELWAWNAEFDIDALAQIEFHENIELRINCAMKLFAFLYPGQRKKLALAADYLGLPVDGAQHHTALYDAQLLESVWFRIKDQQMAMLGERDRVRTEAVFEQQLPTIAPY
jgi:DNA polymerase III epsilon subunit-like protein